MGQDKLVRNCVLSERRHKDRRERREGRERREKTKELQRRWNESY